jgi:hypothetical protein
MMWHLLTMNPDAVSGLYASVPPLTGLAIVRLQLDREGPRLEIHGNLPTFPDNPPARWVRDGFNTAQLQLDCLGVSDLRINGWGTDPVVDVELSKVSDRQIRLSAKGRTCELSLVTEFVRIAGVHGYAKAS